MTVSGQNRKSVTAVGMSLVGGKADITAYQTPAGPSAILPAEPLDAPNLAPPPVGNLAAAFDVANDAATAVSDLQTATVTRIVDITHP